MTKTGLFFKLGFGLALTVFSYSATSAQTKTKTAVQQAGVPTSNVQSNPVTVTTKVEPGTSQTKVENSAKQIDAAKPVSSGARHCTPRANNHPYSITRADFNNLPKDRQKFILDNLNKYSIID